MPLKNGKYVDSIAIQSVDNAIAPATDLTVAAPGKWYKITLDVQCAMPKPCGKVISAKVIAEN